MNKSTENINFQNKNFVSTQLIFMYLLKKWKFILTSIFLGLIFGLFVFFTSPNIYQTQSVIRPYSVNDIDLSPIKIVHDINNSDEATRKLTASLLTQGLTQNQIKEILDLRSTIKYSTDFKKIIIVTKGESLKDTYTNNLHLSQALIEYINETYENALNDLVLEKKTISMKLANNRDLYKRILDTYGKDKNSIPFLAITPYLDERYEKIQMQLLEIEKKLSPNKTMPAHYLQKPVLPTAPLTPKINPLIFGFSFLGFILGIFYLLVRLSFSLNTHR
jgi:LPS O-antigen subunit length determinant protein (WzzB/FepE family)